MPDRTPTRFRKRALRWLGAGLAAFLLAHVVGLFFWYYRSERVRYEGQSTTPAGVVRVWCIPFEFTSQRSWIPGFVRSQRAPGRCRLEVSAPDSAGWQPFAIRQDGRSTPINRNQGRLIELAPSVVVDLVAPDGSRLAVELNRKTERTTGFNGIHRMTN